MLHQFTSGYFRLGPVIPGEDWLGDVISGHVRLYQVMSC